MPTHSQIAKALREGGQLVIRQPKIPAHSQIAKALREGGQLVIPQPKSPAHSQIAKALREGGQLVIRQPKIPTHSQIAKALREGGQLVIRQPSLTIDIFRLRTKLPALPQLNESWDVQFPEGGRKYLQLTTKVSGTPLQGLLDSKSNRKI
jgi:hypothetical protein